MADIFERPTQNDPGFRERLPAAHPREEMPRSAPLDVRAVREKLGLTQAEFARMGRFAVKSISNWENGERVSKSAELILQQLRELQEALCRNLAPDTVGRWLRDPNPYFGGSSPLQLVEQGRIDRLWRAIYRLESGEAS
ncbi:MAG TPA: helix-turn-helix domain-containing protein [Armatimonadota bacterium]|nr:helix-turn-helix domain-containing protein [Armatimonadota bacterium]